ncbi:MAG: hypothetical protein MPJ50_14145 [Pirellulales bacterium]|nr:hypothetical protein [Pirellulales bacterium]
MTIPQVLRFDSPWLWVGIFAVAGIVGVLTIAPKYSERRAKLDLQFEGRQRAMEQKSQDALAASAKQAELAQTPNSGVWLIAALTVGGVMLTGFALYVFRGGYLRPVRHLAKSQDDQPTHEDVTHKAATTANREAGHQSTGSPTSTTLNEL